MLCRSDLSPLESLKQSKELSKNVFIIMEYTSKVDGLKSPLFSISMKSYYCIILRGLNKKRARNIFTIKEGESDKLYMQKEKEGNVLKFFFWIR